MAYVQGDPGKAAVPLRTPLPSVGQWSGTKVLGHCDEKLQ